MMRRAPQIFQLLTLGKDLVQLGNNALETYRDTKELQLHYQKFLAALEEHSTLIQEFMDYRFGERRYALDNFFIQLDKAVTNRDHKTVSALAADIIALLEQNPLHDFDNFQKALQDPNFVIEL